MKMQLVLDDRHERHGDLCQHIALPAVFADGDACQIACKHEIAFRHKLFERRRFPQPPAALLTENLNRLLVGQLRKAVV